jgi:WD40 repeat protein
MFLHKMRTALALTLCLVAALAGAGLLLARPDPAAPPAPPEAPAEKAAPAGKWAERATLLRDNKIMVSGVAFSPDGKAFASAGQQVVVWDAARLAETATLRGLKQGAKAVAFSPDGKALAVVAFDHAGGPTAINTVVHLWDPATGKVLASARAGSNAVAFSPDGKTLAAAGYRMGMQRRVGEVKLLDAATLKAQAALPFGDGEIHAAAFSGDGKVLATGGFRVDLGEPAPEVRVWDAATRKKKVSLEGISGLRGMVQCVTLSGDGKLVASADDSGTVKVWETAKGEEVRSWAQPDPRFVRSLALSPDGKTLAAGLDPPRPQPGRPVAGFPPTAADVVLWDVATGKELAALKGHEISVPSLAFSPDGRTLITCGAEGTVKVWELKK